MTYKNYDFIVGEADMRVLPDTVLSSESQAHNKYRQEILTRIKEAEVSVEEVVGEEGTMA